MAQWGLSDAIGPILIGDVEQELFLGRDIQSRREVSEQTAQLVDAEVKRVLFDAHARAVAVLNEHRSLLEIVAAQLLERETLTRDDIIQLKAGKTLGPRPTDNFVSPSIPASPSAPLIARPIVPPLMGGPEPSPA